MMFLIVLKVTLKSVLANGYLISDKLFPYSVDDLGKKLHAVLLNRDM